MRLGQIETHYKIDENVLHIFDPACGRYPGRAVPNRMPVIAIGEYELRAGLIVTDISCHVAPWPIKINVSYIEVLANMRED